MDINIKSNIPDFIKEVNQKIEQTPEAVQNGVVESTKAVFEASRQALKEEVYNKPIPRRKNGQPAWKRTGNLLQQEKMYFPSRFKGVVENRAPYAAARHDLNKPSPTDGVVRTAPWQKDAFNKVQPKVQKTMEEAIKPITE